MNARIYVVVDTQTNSERLVSANSQAQAVRHVVGERFSAAAASAGDVAKLMQAGVKLETAGADSAPIVEAAQ